MASPFLRWRTFGKAPASRTGPRNRPATVKDDEPDSSIRVPSRDGSALDGQSCQLRLDRADGFPGGNGLRPGRKLFDLAADGVGGRRDQPQRLAGSGDWIFSGE